MYIPYALAHPVQSTIEVIMVKSAVIPKVPLAEPEKKDNKPTLKCAAVMKEKALIAGDN